MSQSQREWAEIITADPQKGKTKIPDLLEPKLRELQDKLRKHTGELIVAKSVTLRNEEDIVYPRTTIQAGIITESTTFPIDHQSFGLGFGLVSKVEKATQVKLESQLPEFMRSKDESLFNWAIGDITLMLYFMERPISEYVTEPRLRLSIGDAEAIPLLQESLKGYQYQGLSKELEKELPLSQEMINKIQKEQVDLYRDVLAAERSFENYNDWFQRRMAQIKGAREPKGPSTRPQMPSTEMHDPVSFALNFGQQLSENERALFWLMEIGIARAYHKENGTTIEIREEEGVKLTLDAKAFFFDRFQKYELPDPNKLNK